MLESCRSTRRRRRVAVAFQCARTSLSGATNILTLKWGLIGETGLMGSSGLIRRTDLNGFTFLIPLQNRRNPIHNLKQIDFILHGDGQVVNIKRVKLKLSSFGSFFSKCRSNSRIKLGSTSFFVLFKAFIVFVNVSCFQYCHTKSNNSGLSILIIF